MKMVFILVNVPLDEAILFFISVSHLVSGVIVKANFSKVPACFFYQWKKSEGAFELIRDHPEVKKNKLS